MSLLKIRHVVRKIDLDRLGILVLVDDVRLEIPEVGDSDPLTDVEVRIPLQTLRKGLRSERVAQSREPEPEFIGSQPNSFG